MPKYSMKDDEVHNDETNQTIAETNNLDEDRCDNLKEPHPIENDNEDQKFDEKRKKKKKKSKDRDREKKHRDGSREKDKERDREKDKEKDKTKENKIEKRNRADSLVDKVDNDHHDPRKKRNLSLDRRGDDNRNDQTRRRCSPSPAYRRRSPSPRRDKKDKDRHREKERDKGHPEDIDKMKATKKDDGDNIVESSNDVKIDEKENLEGKTDIKDKDHDDVVIADKDSMKANEKTKDVNRDGGTNRDRERDRLDRDRDRGVRNRRSPSPRYRRRSPSPRRRQRSLSRERRRNRSPERDRRDYDRDRERGSRRSGRSSERDRNRDKSKDRDNSRDRKKKDNERSSHSTGSSSSSSTSSNNKNEPKPLSLKDIISAYPGISIAEAAQRLNAHNSALALGLPPPGTAGAEIASAAGYGSNSSNMTSGVSGGAGGVSMMGNSMGAITIAGLGGLIGEGGALTKPHRELYVGNIPPGTTVPQLADFLNAIMKQLGLTTSTVGCIITAWVSTDGHFAFVEFRTIEETLSALQYLNGLQIGAHVLKVGRPKGYGGPGTSAVSVPMGMVPPQPQYGLNMAGVNAAGAALGSLGALSLGASSLTSIMSSAGTAVPTGINGFGMMSGMMGGQTNSMISTSSTSSMFNNPMSNVIMVTNLPLGINEEQVRELVSTFGEVKAFNLIKTADTSQSAVLEYFDVKVTDDAILGLNKLEIANYRLAVQRVPAESAAILLQPIHSSQSSNGASSTNTASTLTPALSIGPPVDPLASLPATRILRLSNMTVDEDLIDDELFEELKEDIAEECGKYGDVLTIIIPRQSQYSGDAAITDVSQQAAVGQIFLQYSTVAGAEVARKAVAGRSFNGKIVLAYFYPEELFAKKIYVIPANYFNSNGSATPAQATTAPPVSLQQKGPSPTAMEDPDSYFNDIDEMD